MERNYTIPKWWFFNPPASSPPLSPLQPGPLLADLLSRGEVLRGINEQVHLEGVQRVSPQDRRTQGAPVVARWGRGRSDGREKARDGGVGLGEIGTHRGEVDGHHTARRVELRSRGDGWKAGDGQLSRGRNRSCERRGAGRWTPSIVCGLGKMTRSTLRREDGVGKGVCVGSRG